jgi:hypothetical protein
VATYNRPILSKLIQRLTEPRRFLQVMAGPRQVGNPAEPEPNRHNIEKLDPSLKCLRRPMNTGDHAWHEKYPAKDVQNSNG